MEIKTNTTRISIIGENTIRMSNISTNNSVFADITDDDKMNLVRALLPKEFVIIKQDELDYLLEDSEMLGALEMMERRMIK